MALNNLGETCRELGRSDDAMDRYRQSLNVRRQAGDRQGEAVTLQDLGNVLCDACQPEAISSPVPGLTCTVTGHARPRKP